MERAALSLAASVVSSIFSMLGAKAAPYFGGDITDEELQHLQNNILPKFRTVLRVAEAVPVDELKPWLRTLQDAAYEAEDVLDTYEYKRLQADAKVSSLSYPLEKLKKKAKDLVAPLCLRTELKEIMKKLQRSADEADKLIPLYGAISQTPLMQNTIQQLPSVSSPSSPVFGRDEERESLVNMLIPTTNKHSNNEKRSTMLAICGLGGFGKTTLAQLVYNDSRVVEHFDTRMWVHVSRKFDVHKVTTEIIESATKGEGSTNLRSLDVLQIRLKDILKSKKFLLVLDDVWCQDSMQWDQMLLPLNEVGGTASRILVTTRTQEVASTLGIEHVVALNDLSYEHCMSIFKHYSFGDANEVIQDRELATVAEQIIEKLKKSPLSARMVGSLLRRTKNVADWKQILNKDEMLKDTLNALYLSFDNLSPHLQRCFAFCSLYPKGCGFTKKQVDVLVRFWIAEGFVDAPYNDITTIEDTGMHYFNELVSNSFFQKYTRSDEEDYYYVIHDLLHDLAENVSKDHCLRIEDDTSQISATVMHLSIFTENPSLHIPHIFKLVNLRTFIIHYISKDDFDSITDVRNKMFDKFKKLRVLHLGYERSSKLHKSIGQLQHLRLLQVRGLKRLPESLGRLYHLQFLNPESWKINELAPKNLNKINLRFLYAKKEIFSKIPLLGKLVSLQRIKEYNASRKKGYGIRQLKNLQQLRGSLSIHNLETVRDKAKAFEASLKEKKSLDKLELIWKHSPKRDGRIDEAVIEGLDPPSNLRVLRIYGYNGVASPKWLLNDGGFSNLHLSRLSKLFIEFCPNLRQVPGLPSTLKELTLCECENLCEVSFVSLDLRVVTVESCPKLKQLSPFPSNIERLSLRHCPGIEILLSNILLFEGEDEQPNQQQQFPLKTLSITRCAVSERKSLSLFSCSLSKLCLSELPWLTSIFHLDQNLTSLEFISIVDCENVELLGSSLASASSLRQLRISNCPRLTMQPSQSKDGSFLLPSSLRTLEFGNFGDPEMNLLGRCLVGLTSLTRLDLAGYSRARSLPELANPGAIESLRVSDCPELTSMWDLHPFASLRDLHVIGCPKLRIGGVGETLPPLPIRLTIDDLSLLTALLPQREFLNSLPELAIEGCTQGTAFTEEQEELFQHLNSLTHLHILGCRNLTSLPANTEKLSSLRTLSISGCPNIVLLPSLPASLTILSLYSCENLNFHHLYRYIITEMEKLPSLKHLIIRRCPKHLINGNGEDSDRIWTRAFHHLYRYQFIRLVLKDGNNKSLGGCRASEVEPLLG